MLSQRVHAARPAFSPNIANRAAADTPGFSRPTIVAALLAGLIATAWLLHRSARGCAAGPSRRCAAALPESA